MTLVAYLTCVRLSLVYVCAYGYCPLWVSGAFIIIASSSSMQLRVFIYIQSSALQLQDRPSLWPCTVLFPECVCCLSQTGRGHVCACSVILSVGQDSQAACIRVYVHSISEHICALCMSLLRVQRNIYHCQ